MRFRRARPGVAASRRYIEACRRELTKLRAAEADGSLGLVERLLGFAELEAQIRAEKDRCKELRAQAAGCARGQEASQSKTLCYVGRI